MFKDKILLKLYKTHGPHKFEDKSEHLMEELIEAIISQQLSIRAADTIYSRFLKLFKTNKFPTPEQILKIDTEKLRASGMSYSKAAYVKNIAQAFKNKSLDIKKNE